MKATRCTDATGNERGTLGGGRAIGERVQTEEAACLSILSIYITAALHNFLAVTEFSWHPEPELRDTTDWLSAVRVFYNGGHGLERVSERTFLEGTAGDCRVAAKSAGRRGWSLFASLRTKFCSELWVID